MGAETPCAVGLASRPSAFLADSTSLLCRMAALSAQEKSCSWLVSNYYSDTDSPSVQPPLQLGMRCDPFWMRERVTDVCVGRERGGFLKNAGSSQHKG